MADRHTIALKRKESGMATISKTNGLVGGTLASDIHHRLREDIVSCVLEPGQRLRFEQLKEIYGASYSTLREALSSLVAEQLVVAEGQRGFRVASISAADLLDLRSEEHTSELQSLMRISYAVFCLKNKN